LRAARLDGLGKRDGLEAQLRAWTSLGEFPPIGSEGTRIKPDAGRPGPITITQGQSEATATVTAAPSAIPSMPPSETSIAVASCRVSTAALAVAKARGSVGPAVVTPKRRKLFDRRPAGRCLSQRRGCAGHDAKANMSLTSILTLTSLLTFWVV
jgi:hypothetical protein